MKVKNLHAYRIAPMDFGWERLVPVDEYVASLVKEDKEVRIETPTEFGMNVLIFYGFLHRALDAGRKVGWEGDFRGEPYVGFLPDPHEPRTYLVWKQENNGDTFVVSPVELPYLEKQK